MRPPIPSQISETALWRGVESVDTRGVNPSQLAYLDHAEAFARWSNTWLNPVWSFAYWFPQDSGDPPAQSVWPVDGAPVSMRYWADARTQWVSHPALAPGDNLQLRTTLLSAPCTDGELDTWIGHRFGCGPTSWFGVCRFESQAPPLGTLTLGGSAPVTGIEGTTVSFAGGTWTASPPSGSTAVAVAFELAQFASAPFLAPATRVELRGVFTGQTAAVLWQEGQDGTVQAVANPWVSNTWVTRPVGEVTTFAGSWAQNYGAGFVTDTGADRAGLGGLSLATMGDPERRQVPGLLPGRQARRFVLRFTVPSPLASVQITTLQLRAPGTQWSVWPETAGQFTFAQDTGPGLRWDAVYWNRLANAFIPAGSPPFAAAAGVQNPSAGDAMCFQRETFEGVARDFGLDAEIAQLWDSEEYTLRAHLWRNPQQRQTTHSFARHGGDGLPRFLLVTSLRETPALALLPHEDRDAQWVRTGTPTNRVWHFSSATRRLVSNPSGAAQGDALHLTVGGSVWTGLELWGGWAFASYRRAVLNNEQGVVRRGGQEVADVRPWHGWSALARWTPKAGRPLYSVGPALEHLLVLTGSEPGASLSPNAAVPPLYAALDLPVPLASGGASLDHGWRNPVLAVSEQGVVGIWQSLNGGATWGSAVANLANGTQPAIVCSRTGRTFVYYLRGGLLYVRVGTPALDSWSAEVACGPSGLADSPIDAAESVGPSGAWRMILVATTAAGQVAQYSSNDGVSFT